MRLKLRFYYGRIWNRNLSLDKTLGMLLKIMEIAGFDFGYKILIILLWIVEFSLWFSIVWSNFNDLEFWPTYAWIICFKNIAKSTTKTYVDNIEVTKIQNGGTTCSHFEKFFIICEKLANLNWKTWLSICRKTWQPSKLNISLG